MDSTESTLLQAAAFEPHGLTGGAPATRHLGFAAWLVCKTKPATLVGLGGEDHALFDGLRQVLQHTGQEVHIRTFDLGQGDGLAPHGGDAGQGAVLDTGGLGVARVDRREVGAAQGAGRLAEMQYRQADVVLTRTKGAKVVSVAKSTTISI